MSNRKTNDLSIDLASIKDGPTREAFRSVLSFVNDLRAKGVDSDGRISGKEIRVNSAGFTVDKDGNVIAPKFGCQLDGMWSTAYFEGELDTVDDTIALEVPGEVIGAIGWGSKGGSSDVWHPLGPDSGVGRCDVTFNQSSSSKHNKVFIYNQSATDSNRYKLLVFYKGTQS